MVTYEQVKTRLFNQYIASLHGLADRAAAESVAIMLASLLPSDIDGTWEDVGREIAESTRAYQDDAIGQAVQAILAADRVDGVTTDASLVATAVEHIRATMGHPLGADEGAFLLKIRPKMLLRGGVAVSDVVRDASARVAAHQLSATIEASSEVAKVIARGRGELWARRAFANCCAFCAMLATREAEYRSQATAQVKVHDGCRCVAIPESMLRGVTDPTVIAAKEAYRRSKGDLGAMRREWVAELAKQGIMPTGSRSAQARAAWSPSRMDAYRAQQRDRMRRLRERKRAEAEAKKASAR